MKIINKTRCPLDALLKSAARAVGVVDNIAVKVTQGRGTRISGVAINSTPMQVKLVLPKRAIDPLSTAMTFWRVVAHEFGHILDYQAMRRGEERNMSGYAHDWSRRQMPHDQRPCEIRADQYARDAEALCNKDAEEAIIALGEWFAR